VLRQDKKQGLYTRLLPTGIASPIDNYPKLLDIYIARAIIRAASLTILALVFLLVFFKFVDELEDLQTGDYQLIDAFLVALLSAPRHLFEAFPMAALLGGLLGLGGLAGHGELTAMRAAGFSITRIILAVLKTGILMMIVVIGFGEWIAPASEQYAQQWRLEKQQGQVTLKTANGFWARDGQTYVSIQQIQSGTQLTDIALYTFDDQNRLREHSVAQSAEYRDGRWVLNAIARTTMNANGTEADHDYRPKADWATLLSPGLLDVIIVEPALLTLQALHQSIAYLRENGQGAIDYRVAYWFKIATPLSALLMLLLAVPFVLSQQQRGAGQRVFIGAVIGAGYFLTTRGMSYAAVVYEINPFFATLTPALLCLIGIVYLLRQIR
jgi:lipopolysaccharide export system permease protein